MAGDYSDTGIEAKWNLDAAEGYIISTLKFDFIEYIKNWNLEKAYWTLRLLRMEFDAKLRDHHRKKIEMTEEDKETNKKEKNKQTEKEECDEKMSEVDTARIIFISSPQTDIEKSDYFIVLEKAYMYLCKLMKIHGLYFREGEDSTYAVLRR